ncbi:hypothetical protein [Almyronema epifaneia]|uniref:Glucose-6-phosphate dehydrogenase n=1 Tax=Almyronema epifaneia S1 TaxID=2991925 RepID=A0ABW6I9G2_9CYAN
MVAITKPDIPDTITTLEQLHAWSGLALENLFRGQTYKETTGDIDSGLAPLTDASIVTAADKSVRLISRTSIELNPSYQSDSTKKLWEFAEPLGDALLPNSYKS